jgi:site-specific recombinase XerD
MSEKIIQLKDSIKGFIFHFQYEKNLSSKTINTYSIDLKQFQSYIDKQNAIPNINEISKDLIKDYL